MWRRAKSAEVENGQLPAAQTDPAANAAAGPVTGSASASARTPHGYLDGVVGGHVLGWCWLRDEPDTRLTVEVVIDDVRVASGKADELRETVAEAGFGDGCYGFRIPIARTLADGGTHRITVAAAGVSLRASPSFARTSAVDDPDDPWASTTFTPERVTESRSARPAVEPTGVDAGRERGPEPAPALRGYVDGIVADAVVGWVVDEGRPDLAVGLEAFLDGVFIGSAKADAERLDVARAGYGERHGFNFQLPTSVEPGEYQIEVRTVGDRWRVPLVTDYTVYDDRRQKLAGISLKEPRLSGQHFSREALIGRDGWMFEWPGSRVFDILTGNQAVPRPVFERQLERLLARRDQLKGFGGTLIETVIPAKLAIYSEHLPSGVAFDDSARPATELAAALLEENGIDLVDLAVALRHGKRDGLVFSRTGRDLTWMGGFLAYRVLAKELSKRRPELDPLPRSVLEFGELEPVSDNLADLPRLAWVGSHTVPAGPGAHDEEREGRERLSWRKLSCEYAVVPPELAAAAGSSAALLRFSESDRRATAIVLHDGSAAAIVPFMAEHFSELLVAGSDADLDQLLEALTPEAVLEIVAERSLLLV